MNKTYCLLLLIAFGVTACPTPVQKTIAPIEQQVLTQDPVKEKKFDDAVDAFENEDYDTAHDIFLQLNQGTEEPLLIAHSMTYLGRIAFARGQVGEARVYLNEARELGAETSVADYATLYLAEVELASGNFSLCIELLEPLDGRFPATDVNLQLLELAWSAAYQSSTFVLMAKWGERLVRFDGSESKEASVVSEIERGLSKESDYQKLRDIASKQRERGVIWARILGRAALLAHGHKDFAVANEIMVEIRESGDRNRIYAEQTLSVIESIHAADMRNVGVLVPLSGKMRIVGQSILKGIVLGSERFRLGTDRSPLSLVIKDTGLDDVTIETLVRDLIEKDNVGAIIGPVNAKYARTVTRMASQYGVPVLLLTAAADVAAQSDCAFRKFASNELEVNALWMVLNSDQRGNVAILYPDNAYGRLMKQLMATRLAKENLSYVKEVTFDPASKDFAAEAQALSQTRFDALFMPVTSAQIALLAPHLAAKGIWPANVEAPERAVYLLPSVAYSDNVVARAGRYLQGARFVQVLTSVISPGTVVFDNAFYDKYKRAPDVFSAYGFDATVLIGEGVKNGVEDRIELKRWLQNLEQSSSTALRFTGFADSGEAQAPPDVFMLKGDALAPVATAVESAHATVQ